MSGVQTYSANQFLQTVERHEGLELIHFASPLFTGCKYVSNQIQELAAEFEGLLSFGEVVVDLQKTELIRAFEVEQLPTVILLHAGEEVERLETILRPDDMREMLELCVSFYAPVSPVESDENSEPE